MRLPDSSSVPASSQRQPAPQGIGVTQCLFQTYWAGFLHSTSQRWLMWLVNSTLDQPRLAHYACSLCVCNYVAADPGGQLPGPDRGSDEGQDHRGGQEGAGGQRAEWRSSGEDPATQSRRPLTPTDHPIKFTHESVHFATWKLVFRPEVTAVELNSSMSHCRWIVRGLKNKCSRQCLLVAINITTLQTSFSFLSLPLSPPHHPPGIPRKQTHQLHHLQEAEPVHSWSTDWWDCFSCWTSWVQISHNSWFTVTKIH